MGMFDRFKTKDRGNSNKDQIKVYELWIDHTYRTYETSSKQGYKTYEFEGKVEKNREFDLIHPNEDETEKDKPMGDVFSVEISSS